MSGNEFSVSPASRGPQLFASGEWRREDRRVNKGLPNRRNPACGIGGITPVSAGHRFGPVPFENCSAFKLSRGNRDDPQRQDQPSAMLRRSLPSQARSRGVTAVLGPTNTGKTHLAIERMLGHESGMIGLP
ncbi:MAG TPA: hypothetical protein VKB16_13535, partial [Beijerinckiaceae bacterium]|nr:hypothetical protein [Beijerinckiaceae bacterium]